jgi:NAD(P)-dependent dehydrogenase (short-subunit alcohol dehydrogenase family)
VKGLQGKIIIVAGGAGSIGQAIIERLSDEGSRCVCIDSSAERLGLLSTRFGAKLLTIAADLGDEHQVEAALRDVEAQLGKAHCLVNAAAIIGPTTEIVDLEIADFDALFKINVRAAFLTLRAMLRRLRANAQRGSIVNFSSTASARVRPGRSLYAMSKRAVEAMTIAAASENRARGIRVNCVAPGPIESEMYRSMISQSGGTMGDVTLGQPRDVASLVAFLLSDEAAHCTCHVYFVDAGTAA